MKNWLRTIEQEEARHRAKADKDVADMAELKDDDVDPCVYNYVQYNSTWGWADSTFLS